MVDALRCAIDVQNVEAKRNAGLLADRQLAFRIGINLGDVIIEGDDIHGDGVNIADRLQALAEPGGIVISGTAYDQVAHKINAGFESLGEQRVKNIAAPVRVYRVLLDALAASKIATDGAGTLRLPWRLFPIPFAVFLLVIAVGAAVWWQRNLASSGANGQLPMPDRPSIAVLPFDNISGLAEQNYLADGMTEDLTTDLARVPGLFVVSRNAALQYKDKPVDLAEVAAKLRVQYVLEGSVRRMGNQLRINAQLIDTSTGSHKWAERFDGAWSDVFSLQDKVIQRIVTALEVRLLTAQLPHAPGSTNIPAAYDAYLQGLELYLRDTPDDLARAIPHLERAVMLDPEYGQAYAVLASVYWRGSGWPDALKVTNQEAMSKVNQYLTQAMKHPSPRAYRVAADMLQYEQRFDQAITLLQRATALDPSDASVYGKMAEVLMTSGRCHDGQSYLDAAIRLDPSSLSYYDNLVGEVQFCLAQFEKAAATLEKDVAANPDDPYPLIVLLAAYGHLGRSSDTASLVNRLSAIAARQRADAATLLWVKALFPYKQRQDAERLREGLRKVGVPELPFGYQPAPNDRLAVDEVKSRLFGHTVEGLIIGSNQSCSLTWTTKGAETQSCGTMADTTTLVQLEEDGICYWSPWQGRDCRVFLRNPEGSSDRRNEFLMVSPWWRFQFSIAK